MDKTSANFFLHPQPLLFLFPRRGPTDNLRFKLSQRENDVEDAVIIKSTKTILIDFGTA